MQDNYRTKDMYEAAFLVAKKNRLLNFKKDSVRDFYWFVFDESCEEQSQEYWQGEASINAKVFVDSIRSLKDRIFSK